MRYFIKRTSDADGTVFNVLDGLCSPTYRVGTLHPFPSCRLQVEDDNGVAAKIVKVSLQSLGAYSVSCTNMSFRIMLNGDSCAFHGVDWRVRGSITAKNFDITDTVGNVIAVVASHSTVANALELNVFDKQHEMACICATVCLNLAQTVDNLSVQPV